VKQPLDPADSGLPPVPDSARQVFGDALPRAEEYAGLLAGEATLRGLIGPREVPRLWERHLLNCAVVTELIAPGSTVCDVGSGAGLPGIVLAIRRPDIRVNLLEPLLRRSTFLQSVVLKMELSNVVVHRGRAEDVAGTAGFEMGFDVVISRAVAPMERLARWSLPLTRSGGQMLAMKGSAAADEVARAADAITRAGGTDVSVHSVGGAYLDPPVTVVRVLKGRARTTTE
jgi:16S rRNA (guanine527-N7)-methyltransferase